MERLKNIKELTFTQLYTYFLGFVSFVFCISPKVSSICIVGLLGFTIAGFVKRKICFQFNKAALFLCLLYLAYLVGVLFTNHQNEANDYLVKKLSLLIFPLLLSFRFKEEITFKSSALGLMFGVVVASMMGLFHSYVLYKEVGDFNNSFGSVRFSYIHHPSYFSIFLTMAIVSCWYGYFQKWKRFNLLTALLFTFFALTMQFFCFSLAGMLFLFLLGLTIYIVITYKYLSKFLFTISTVLIPIIPVVLYNSNIHIRIEVDSALSVVKEFTGKPVDFIKNKKNTASGSEIRVIMWIVAYQELKEHLFGVGTANMDDHLEERLMKYDQKELAKAHYNPHNQFLQTGIEIGIIGLGILLLMIITTFYFAWKHKNWILFILISNLVFNSLFESMLQRQSGVVFYSFWICLLMIYSNSKKGSQKEIIHS